MNPLKMWGSKNKLCIFGGQNLQLPLDSQKCLKRTENVLIRFGGDYESSSSPLPCTCRLESQFVSCKVEKIKNLQSTI